VDADAMVHELAARQFGCLADRQALTADLTRAQIRYRLATGRYERLGVAVLRVAGSPPTWEQSLMAGLLDLGPLALVSHRSAAALMSFDSFRPGPVEFTMPRSGRGLSAHWVVHTTRHLPKVDRDQIGPFLCTSASRTIIDLARSCSTTELERAIDAAIRDGRTSPTFLRRRLQALRGRGRYGVRRLDELLVDSGGHSALERAFLGLVRRAGLPRPHCQRIYQRDGKTIARVDFAFEPHPVVAEVSGRRGHSTAAERAKDARRRNELQSMGVIVLEFTYQDVFERPDYVLNTLRYLLPNLLVSADDEIARNR
jgi:very-short-patch-repair endonuclease